MITLGFLAFFGVVVAISALFGLVRGLNKSVIRFITLILAAVLTFVVAGPVTNSIIQEVRVDGMSLGELLLEGIGSSEMMASVMSGAPLLREAILVLPAFLLSIIVFPLVFAVLKFVTYILFLCIQKPLRKAIFKESFGKEKCSEEQIPQAECSSESASAQFDDAGAPAVHTNTKPSVGVRVAKRFGGLAVGVVTGVLIFAMTFAPVFGLFSALPSSSTVNGALNAMVEQDMFSASDVQMIQDVYSVTDSGLIKFYDLIGITAAGKAYIDSVSTIEADGYTTSVSAELNSLLGAVQTTLDSGALTTLMNAEDQSELFALLADQEFVDALMQDLFQSKMLCAMVPEVVASAMESVAASMNVPADKDAVYDRMMDDISVAVKGAQIDYAGIAAYEKAYGITPMNVRGGESEGSTELMTEEAYNAEIEKLLKLTESISAILNTAISGDNAVFANSVATEIINEVKVQVAENGQGAIDSFDAQNTISAIDAANVDAGEGSRDALMAQLTDKEKFETDVATVETIKESVKESIQAAIADEEKAGETAGTLATVVSNLAEAVASATDEEGNMDITKMDFSKLANAVTELQNSTLKGVGSSLLDIITSGELGKNEMLGGVLEAVKDGYDKGEDIGGAINTAGSLINMGSAMGGGDSEGKPNEEQMIHSITDLISNLNEFTISLLPSIFSTDTIISMGVPAEYAQTAYNLVETLLKELVKLQDSEDYTNEVNTLLYFYNLATSGVQEFTQEDVKVMINNAINSDAIYNTLMSLSTSNPFGIELPEGAALDELVTAIEEVYNQTDKSQRAKDACNAIAALLGLDGKVELN